MSNIYTQELLNNKPRLDFEKYSGYRQECMAVLKTIRDRKMKIDQSWFEYLLN